VVRIVEGEHGFGPTVQGQVVVVDDVAVGDVVEDGVIGQPHDRAAARVAYSMQIARGQGRGAKGHNGVRLECQNLLKRVLNGLPAGGCRGHVVARPDGPGPVDIVVVGRDGALKALADVALPDAVEERDPHRPEDRVLRPSRQHAHAWVHGGYRSTLGAAPTRLHLHRRPESRNDSVVALSLGPPAA